MLTPTMEMKSFGDWRPRILPLFLVSLKKRLEITKRRNPFKSQLGSLVLG